MSRKLFTVGHSNNNIEKFIKLLKNNNVTALADVRSHPHSRYLSHFNQAELKFYLKEAQIRYVFLGNELGARPKDDSCYVDGKAIYEKISARDIFVDGIKRLVKGSKKYQIALMCAEKDPITCHRAVLVCHHLKKFNLDINHIHQDSSLESHQHLEDRLLKLNGYNEPKQLDIFEQSQVILTTQMSEEEALKEAYISQGLKIAYVEK